MIDADSRVILITTGATHESQVYIAQIEKIQLKQTIADRAYYLVRAAAVKSFHKNLGMILSVTSINVLPAFI